MVNRHPYQLARVAQVSFQHQENYFAYRRVGLKLVEKLAQTQILVFAAAGNLELRVSSLKFGNAEMEYLLVIYPNGAEERYATLPQVE